MLVASIPAKFNIPFANSAGGGFTRPVPEASQIGIQAGAASLTDGFPPVCFLPIGAGGTPPWGADFNGLLNQISAWCQWQAAGGKVAYDSAFSTAIGGYPNGAFVASAVTDGLYWLNGTDGNTTDPDAGGAGWSPVAFLGGTMTTGDWKWRPTAETLPGWVKANATTIGNAASGASQLAAATAWPLFNWLWTNFSNSQCPVLPSGRGASSTVDFAANKTIAVLDLRGITPLGMDTMGGSPTTTLASVPVTSGSATQAGSVLGESLHVLLTAELAAHSHGVTDPGHAHGTSDPGHIHSTGDPGHVHGVTDPTHQHAIQATAIGYGAGGQSAITIGGVATAATNNASTGVSINSSTTGLSVSSHTTGLTVSSNTTGITTNNNGSNTAHNTVQRSMTGTHYLKL